MLLTYCHRRPSGLSPPPPRMCLPLVGLPRVSFITAPCSLSSSPCIPLPTLATLYPIRCLRSPPLLSTEITMYYLVHYVEMTSATAREWPRMLNMLTERPLLLVCPQIVVRACCWSRQHRDQREPGGSRSVWQRGPAVCGVSRCVWCSCSHIARSLSHLFILRACRCWAARRCLGPGR